MASVIHQHVRLAGGSPESTGRAARPVWPACPDRPLGNRDRRVVPGCGERADRQRQHEFHADTAGRLSAQEKRGSGGKLSEVVMP